MNTEVLKKQAAKAAVDLIEEGMIVGLGSGSTAAYAVVYLAERISSGLKIIAIPTSVQTKMLAEKHHIKLTTFAENPIIDITIDGADQVERGSLNLVKGLGNALLREKIVAKISKKLVIMVDETKIVNRLGSKSPVPVEIVPFGWEVTQKAIAKYCPSSKLRIDEIGKPIITDSNHYILDCYIPEINNAHALAQDLKLITGVVDTGLFINMTKLVLVAKQNGVEQLENE